MTGHARTSRFEELVHYFQTIGDLPLTRVTLRLGMEYIHRSYVHRRADQWIGGFENTSLKIIDTLQRVLRYYLHSLIL